METIQLYCKQCHQAVSGPLCVDERVRDVGNPSLDIYPLVRDDTVSVDRGHAWRVGWTSTQGVENMALWLSPKDLNEHIVSMDFAFGCCGYIGTDNTRCSCGFLIGSRRDECGGMKRFEPNPKTTYWL